MVTTFPSLCNADRLSVLFAIQVTSPIDWLSFESTILSKHIKILPVNGSTTIPLDNIKSFRKSYPVYGFLFAQLYLLSCPLYKRV